MLRIFGTGLERKELAKFLEIDPQSIRRYESHWNTAKIPQWYFHILRFLSGDLSIYGETWINSKIKLHNQKISTPYAPHDEYTPRELNMKYSIVNKKNNMELEKLRNENETLLKEIFRLKTELKNQVVKEQNNVIEFKRVN